MKRRTKLALAPALSVMLRRDAVQPLPGFDRPPRMVMPFAAGGSNLRDALAPLADGRADPGTGPRLRAPDDPLRRAPNTILTPHPGYVTRQDFRLHLEDAVECLRAWDAGAPLRRSLNGIAGHTGEATP
ncbi:hypothetical protein [Muricoccus radiodurans]|uniref:hypothetical protein n=1 Tax=Muricoccus radiodurans TaxID=2231721 RepID=UPI003CF82F23